MNLTEFIKDLTKDVPRESKPTKEERKRRALQVTVRGFQGSKMTRKEFKQKRYGAKKQRMKKRRDDKRIGKITRRMIDYMCNQEVEAAVTE